MAGSGEEGEVVRCAGGRGGKKGGREVVVSGDGLLRGWGGGGFERAETLVGGLGDLVIDGR